MDLALRSSLRSYPGDSRAPTQCPSLPLTRCSFCSPSSRRPCSACRKGGFFGLGLLGVPLMSLYVPPLQGAAILVQTVLAQDALTIWTYRHDWSASNLKIMIPSLAVGIAMATLFAASLSATHIRLAIGLIAGAFVLRHGLGRRFDALASRPTTLTRVVCGVLGGLTTPVANAAGPPWQMHLLPENHAHYALCRKQPDKPPGL